MLETSVNRALPFWTKALLSWRPIWLMRLELPKNSFMSRSCSGMGRPSRTMTARVTISRRKTSLRLRV